MNDIKLKSISATKWSFYGQLGQYALSFILSIILARLLSPEDFGLTGMLTIFNAIAVVLINSGLSVAIVRSKDVNESDLTTMFYFNLGMSLFLYSLIFFLAPFIADFYNEPKLIGLARLLCLVFVINSFGIVQNTVLLRKVNIKLQTICYLVGMAFSVIVSGYMSFVGYGVYSIVGQVLSQALVTTLMLWMTTKWIPIGQFSIESFKKMWKFGSKILATNITSSIIDNIDNLLIGKVFSTANLGFFVRAKSTKEIPEKIFWGTLNSSSFAVLSKVNSNINELKKLHLQFYDFAIFLYLPIVTCLYIVAEPFVVLLYTAKWLPSVPLLQILCIGSIPRFIDGLFVQTFMALGEANVYFRITVLKKSISLISIPIGLIFGLMPFLWSLVVLQYFGMLINIIYINKVIDVEVKNYMKNVALPIFISIVVIIILWMVNKLIFIDSLFLSISFQVFIGFFSYFIFSYILQVKQSKELFFLLMEKYRNIFGKTRF